MNADVFPVVARHGDVVTFGTEAEKSDKRKYVFVFKITNGVVCVQPPFPSPPPPPNRGRRGGGCAQATLEKEIRTKQLFFCKLWKIYRHTGLRLKEKATKQNIKKIDHKVGTVH